MCALRGCEQRVRWQQWPTSHAQLASALSAPLEQTTHEAHSTHAKHHDAGMLGRIVRYSAQVRLDDVVAVEKGQFAVGLDPYLRMYAWLSE